MGQNNMLSRLFTIFKNPRKVQEEEKNEIEIDLLLALGIQSSFSKDHVGAIDYFSKFIDLNPEFDKLETVYVMRGTAYAKIQDYRAFMLDIKKAIEINPLNDNTFFTQGHILAEIKLHDEAIKAFSKAKEINPKNGYAYQGLENAKYDQKNDDQKSGLY